MGGGRAVGLIRLAGAAAVLLWLALPAVAQGQLRGVALVIGQSDYAGLEALRNPERDARALDQLLDDLNFDVTRVLNADAEELRRELTDFATDAAEADVAFVYYSGHGIEAGGENYLIPVDADVSTPESAGQKVVALSPLLDELRATVPVTIILLDACRTNPFGGLQIRLPGAAAPVVASAQGLGTPKGAPLVAPASNPDSLGVVIGFAASPGQAADDGDGENSPYAAALLKHLGAGGDYGFLEIMTMVTREVYVETQSRQLPWLTQSLLRFLRFGTPVEGGDPDEVVIRDGRRQLLLTIDEQPPSLRSFVEAVASSEQVPLDVLYGMLDVLLQTQSSGADLEKALLERARQFNERETYELGDAENDPELRRLVGLAQRAEGEGLVDLSKRFWDRASERARELFPDAKEAFAAAREDARNLADVLAGNAQAAVNSFQFREAAALYREAYTELREIDEDSALFYRTQEGMALINGGELLADNAMLLEAIEVFEFILGELPSSMVMERTSTQIGMATALMTLGDREPTTERLAGAVETLRAALEPTKPYPEVHLTVQTLLAGALVNIAKREPDTVRLSEAVALFRSAVENGRPVTDVFYIANIQVGLSQALAMMSERGAGAEPLRDALEVLDDVQAAVPFKDSQLWMRAQVNRGYVYLLLAQVEHSLEAADLSVEASRLGLQVIDRDKAPIEFARASMNLGAALFESGAARHDPQALKEAIVALDDAVSIYTQDFAPLDWANLQINRTQAYVALGSITNDPAHWQAAVAAGDMAAAEVRQDRDIRQWMAFQYSYALARSVHGPMTANVALAQAAVADLRDLLALGETIEPGGDLRRFELALGMALTFVAQHRWGIGELLESQNLLRRIEATVPAGAVAPDLVSLYASIGMTEAALGEKTHNPGLLLSGRAAFVRVLEIFAALGWDTAGPPFEQAVAEIDAKVAEMAAAGLD